MTVKQVRLPHRIWHGAGTLELDFPANCEIIECRMAGHDCPPLTPKQIAAGFASPIGSARLHELARGKRQVAILFDDISRPTPVKDLLPFVLAELKEAGIADQAIRFICASGCHGAHSYEDFIKKLGQDILDRFPVYNHNIYENCTYAGTTSQGTELYVNSEVMSCDLKIGIGSVITHPQTGFGGGGKIILPGVAAVESIEAYHRLEYKYREEGKGNLLGMSNYQDNPMARDFTEAAGIAGLDFKIDVLVNGNGLPCAIYCGNPEREYQAAAGDALAHYATKPAPGTDVAVVNNYCKGNEAIIGLIIGITLLVEKGGDLVLVMDCPAGQVVHHLIGSFGKQQRGRLFQAVNFSLPWVKRVIVLCPQFEHSMADWLCIPGTKWVKRWRDVREILEEDFPAGAKAAIVPDGTIQYLVPGKS
ncbi:MAG: lactate racemase domain-containing protein [Chloroflexi bacterium]|nr:lactate racemase domain-containing protein [Chloroflexota bacterium]